MKLFLINNLLLGLLALSFSPIPTLSEAATLSDDDTSKKATNIGYILQVTDFHFDPRLSLHCKHKLGMFGTYDCDSPAALINSSLASMLTSMQALQQPYDFIAWTGDSMPHLRNNLYNESDVIEQLSLLTQMMTNRFPNIPLYPVFGNHDYSPSGAFKRGPTKIYTAMANRWAPTGFEIGAYYAKVLNVTSSAAAVKILLLGLNTNLYYLNDNVNGLGDDPAGQFAWMKLKLESARSSGMKVLIIAHVPPGWDRFYTVMKPEYNSKYLNILRNYSDIILPQLYGHEHADRMMVQYDSNGKPLLSFLLCPSIMPEVGNPGYRIIKYNRETFQFLDISTYYMNLTQANTKHTAGWELEYKFSTEYGLSQITTASVGSLLKKISSSQSDRTLFNKYYSHIRGLHFQASACNSTCRQAIQCQMLHPDFPSHTACLRQPTSSGIRSGPISYLLSTAAIPLLLLRWDLIRP